LLDGLLGEERRKTGWMRADEVQRDVDIRLMPNISPLRQGKDDQLVGETASARFERTTRDIDVVATHRRTGTVTSRRHRRQRLPTPGLGIVRLVVRERNRRCLSADHQDHVLVDGGGKTGAGGWQRRSRGPGVAGRIVDVVQVSLVGRGSRAAADDVQLAVDRDRCGVVTRVRQRRELRPDVGCGIEYLVRRDDVAVGIAAADCVNLAAERGHAD
jgi:hypothetical protein